MRQSCQPPNLAGPALALVSLLSACVSNLEGNGEPIGSASNPDAGSTEQSQVAAGLHLEPSTVLLNPGRNKMLSAWLVDESENLVGDQGPLIWQTSNPAVASVVNGEVFALVAGSAVITVSAKGFTTTAALTVVESGGPCDNYLGPTGDTLCNASAFGDYHCTGADGNSGDRMQCVTCEDGYGWNHEGTCDTGGGGGGDAPACDNYVGTSGDGLCNSGGVGDRHCTGSDGVSGDRMECVACLDGYGWNNVGTCGGGGGATCDNYVGTQGDALCNAGGLGQTHCTGADGNSGDRMQCVSCQDGYGWNNVGTCG